RLVSAWISSQVKQHGALRLALAVEYENAPYAKDVEISHWVNQTDPVNKSYDELIAMPDEAGRALDAWAQRYKRRWLQQVKNEELFDPMDQMHPANNGAVDPWISVDDRFEDELLYSLLPQEDQEIIRIIREGIDSGVKITDQEIAD